MCDTFLSVYKEGKRRGCSKGIDTDGVVGLWACEGIGLIDMIGSEKRICVKEILVNWGKLKAERGKYDMHLHRGVGILCVFL